MNRKHAFRSLMIAALTVGMAAGAVRADLYDNLGRGLWAAGFDLRGNRNPLSGGIDFLATNTFVGQEFDFGPWDMTFQGPVSLQLQTGGRHLQEVELHFRTAVDGRSAATPLAYVFNFDSGGQLSQVAGTLLVDGNMTINEFGFYRMDMRYSSRQNVTHDGRFTNTVEQFDLDAGPIAVSGNIYADVLAALTDPIFQVTGIPNIFASFSGPNRLGALFDPSPDTLRRLADGDDLAGFPWPAAALVGQGGPATRIMNFADGAEGGSFAGIVPEPTVLALMLLGIPALLIRRPRRRCQPVAP